MSSFPHASESTTFHISLLSFSIPCSLRWACPPSFVQDTCLLPHLALKFLRVNSILEIVAAKAGLWLISLIFDLGAATWDDRVLSSLDFLANSVLQLPLVLMGLLHKVSPALDQM